MHRNNSLCAVSNEPFELLFIKIEGIGANVAKNRARAPKYKGIDRGDERKRGHDNFVARLNVEQQCRHL